MPEIKTKILFDFRLLVDLSFLNWARDLNKYNYLWRQTKKNELYQMFKKHTDAKKKWLFVQYLVHIKSFVRLPWLITCYVPYNHRHKMKLKREREIERDRKKCCANNHKTEFTLIPLFSFRHLYIVVELRTQTIFFLCLLLCIARVSLSNISIDSMFFLSFK